MRSLTALAWRDLQQHRMRTTFSALAVTLGAAMIVADSVTGSGIRDASTSGENVLEWFTKWQQIDHSSRKTWATAT